jgi:hypothetical protein
MTSRIRTTALVLTLVAAPAAAQPSAAPAASTHAALSAADQIAAAVLPLPAEFRATATVLGYGADGRLTTLRPGTGAFNCLAPDPKRTQFHVACYHKSLEAFMARGRELRASGVADDKVDTTRFAEVNAGKLRMPDRAALYTLTGGSFDPATGKATGARPLYVVYIPGATAATTGIPERPAEGTPWIMYPGTPKAHIMFIPKM